MKIFYIDARKKELPRQSDTSLLVAANTVGEAKRLFTNHYGKRFTFIDIFLTRLIDDFYGTGNRVIGRNYFLWECIPKWLHTCEFPIPECPQIMKALLLERGLDTVRATDKDLLNECLGRSVNRNRSHKALLTRLASSKFFSLHYEAPLMGTRRIRIRVLTLVKEGEQRVVDSPVILRRDNLDTHLITNWIVKYSKNCRNRKVAQRLAKEILASKTYDRNKPIIGVQHRGKSFNIPAPAGLGKEALDVARRKIASIR